tara:strand:- start:414 stop:986 length:573 start_codon:yes stop_codon:yes gene_type:complete
MRTPKNRLQNAQMGMFFILATELMMFLALVSAYIVIRANVPDWPPIGQPRLPAGETALNTLALLLSGWTFYKAIKISKGVKDTFETDFTEIQNSVVKWIWISFALGLFFVAFQGYEWVKLVSYGLTMGSGVYAGFFYTIIGCHAIHTLAGLVLLLILGLKPSYIKLHTIKWYWYFVVGLWPLLYVSVYLV